MVVQHRGLDTDNMMIQLGFDDGQGILKLMQTIKSSDIPTDECAYRKRKYSEGYEGNNSPLSSVKKLFILCAVPKVDETYDNVHQIMKSINFSDIKFTLSCDLKMCLCLCGKQAASSRHPCPFCHAETPLMESSELITLGSLNEHYERFLQSGLDVRKAKEYNNIVRKPLLSGDPNLPILEIINLPELHLMTGITGKILKEMEGKCFETKEQGRNIIDQFLEINNIKRCVYQGSESFEGNQARKILRSCQSLQNLIMEHDTDIQSAALRFVDVLNKFNKVVESSFGQRLQEGYETDIDQFSRAYLDLHVSVTLKVHIVICHLKEFLRLKGGVAGLGFFSEQAMESCHHSFKTEWERNKVFWDHPNCGEKLHQTVVRVNSKNL